MKLGNLLMMLVMTTVSVVIGIFLIHRFTDINVASIGEPGGFLGPKKA